MFPSASVWYFNPLPLYRGRRGKKGKKPIRTVFQSTPSLQRETPAEVCSLAYKSFQSTPSLQRETHFQQNSFHKIFYFNPLPLYRGRRSWVHPFTGALEFQSTPSLQRETSSLAQIYFLCYISIHSLFTEGDLVNIATFNALVYFNPLPLYRGRPSQVQLPGATTIFQSTPSLQRETIIAINLFVA